MGSPTPNGLKWAQPPDIEPSSMSALSGSLLDAFPFAFVVAPDFRLSALGRYFETHHQGLLRRPISDAFTLSRLRGDEDLESHIVACRGRTKLCDRVELAFSMPAPDGDQWGEKDVNRHVIRLVGSFLPCEADDTSMFLGTIAPSEIKNMTALGLTVGDFGPIDPSPGFAMMAEVNASMLADSQLMNEQLRQSRDEALAAKRALERHQEHLEELVKERTATVQRQAAELEEALRQEKRLSELQRSFVSMASHEFRTPLAIIDGNAQRIERRIDKMASEDVKERIKKVRSAVKRMTALMESTLAVRSRCVV